MSSLEYPENFIVLRAEQSSDLYRSYYLEALTVLPGSDRWLNYVARNRFIEPRRAPARTNSAWLLRRLDRNGRRSLTCFLLFFLGSLQLGFWCRANPSMGLVLNG